MLAGLDAIPDYHDCFIRVEDRQKWPFTKPMFMQIPWTTDRLRAQSGFFTFHAESKPLDQVHRKHVRKVDIPDQAISGARKFLAHAGSPSTLCSRISSASRRFYDRGIASEGYRRANS